VIAHLAPGPDAPVETPADPVEIIDECLTILVVQKDIGLRISTCHDVVKARLQIRFVVVGPWVINAQGTVAERRICERL